MLKVVGLVFVKHTLKNSMLLFSDLGAGLCSGSDRYPRQPGFSLGNLVNFVL